MDLKPAHLEIVNNILAAYVPEAEVRVFGSRVNTTAKKHSDLDLAILAEDKLDGRTITRLALAFEESDLPYRVDIVDWHAIDHEFQKIIEEKFEILQKVVCKDTKKIK